MITIQKKAILLKNQVDRAMISVVFNNFQILIIILIRIFIVILFKRLKGK
jgi:hypothetical protein